MDARDYFLHELLHDGRNDYETFKGFTAEKVAADELKHPQWTLKWRE